MFNSLTNREILGIQYKNLSSTTCSLKAKKVYPYPLLILALHREQGTKFNSKYFFSKKKNIYIYIVHWKKHIIVNQHLIYINFMKPNPKRGPMNGHIRNCNIIKFRGITARWRR